jgi:LytS/YehU family sensor histidine kinase
MIMANGALGLALGMAIFFVAIAGVNLIIEGTSALNPRAMQGMFWYALYGFQFPLIGFYITLGDDLAHRGTIQRKEKERFERIAEQARLVALRSQINPHFFFNALNTIAALIPRRPADAERAVELLATALRPVVTRDQPMTTDLQTELQVAQAYAAIEELRLGDRCTFNFQVDQPALKCRMPGLSLQPLLENAVRHGAAKFPGKYGIRLNASCEANTLHVTIENGPDGEPFAEPNRIVQPVKGHALHNIAQRLHILFGPRSVLMVQTGENSSATCRLTVPQDAARPPQ